MEASPAAQEAARKEWDSLHAKGVFDMSGVQEWEDVSRMARESGEAIHHGSLATIVVEKGHELPAGHPGRKFKGRTVFLGDQVRDEEGKAAIFQEISSSPCAMDAGRACDLHGCMPGNVVTSADGVQALSLIHI